MDKNKVVLGLSGGIDSTASALLLKEKGMEVHALYFDVTEDGNEYARNRAEELCKEIGIDFKYVDIHERFEEIIIKPFCKEYENGRTPMPCMVCNPYIKWRVLKEYADEIGAYYLSSGHYGRIEEKDGVYYVRRSPNQKKDQSYMLARLGQEILSRIIFPLSEFTDKKDVKAYVEDHGISIPETLGESQDICFISGDYRDFLAQRDILSKEGNFIGENGEILGKHNGHTGFTIGQGKGFGMGFNKKVYVKKIDPESGDIYLCEDKDLYSKLIGIKICNFAKYGEIDYIPEEYLGQTFEVKIRYAAKPALAVLTESTNKGMAVLSFEDAQRGPTPGQYAVLYKDDLVIGCGIIY